MSVGHVGSGAALAAVSARQDASVAGLNLAQNAQKAEGQAAVALLESATQAKSNGATQNHASRDAIDANGRLDTFV